MIPFWIIVVYMFILLGLGVVSSRLFRGTSNDFFIASRSIGPFMLLMSVFGTTMTAFAMVGSTGQAFSLGIGTYGKMASWSGLIHSACFFFVGIRLWAFGQRHGYLTQIQFFRDRFESNAIGYLLFPVLVGLIIPYLLLGLLGAGALLKGVTKGAFPEVFASTGGAIPPWLTSLIICLVVLSYVAKGGVRSAAWANTFQTIVFMIMGLLAFILISSKLGGMKAASAMADPAKMVRTGNIPELQFFTYCFIPLSVAMFPHLFQHWLTAKSAKTFRLTLVMHPLCIMVTWVPCILIGVWATGAIFNGSPVIPPSLSNPNAVLGIMVAKLTNPYIAGLVSAGVLAAIMSSLDSQFVCLGTMFTEDIVLHKCGKDRFSEKQVVWMARGFIIAIIIVTYLFSLAEPAQVFRLGVWCFSGFAALFPLVFAAVYWKRTTRVGALAAIAVTALTWLGFFSYSGFGKEKLLVFGAMPVAFMFFACALTLVIVSILTSPPSKDTLGKFFSLKAA